MLNKYILFISLVLICNRVDAQIDYEYLRNTKDIPTEFLGDQIDTKVVYDEIDKEKVKDNDRLFSEFQVSNNFSLKNLYNGGLVLYSGPVYDYVNKVAQKIIDQDKSIQRNIRVFIILDPTVNAMALNSGDIFVNVGLIAHLQNEAQLAYILCHEFIHYKEKHIFDRVKETEKVKKDASSYKLYNEQDINLYLNKYSRENESEADRLGFGLFIKSGYSFKEALSALELLKYADFPFENVELKRSDFETTYLKLPQSYFKDNRSEIFLKDFYNDTTRTHPNIGQRKQSVNTLIRIEKSQSPEALFLVGESEFKVIRESCRYELSTLYLMDRDYIASLYNTIILLKDNPNSLYLNRCLIKAYSYLQNVNNNNRISILVANPKKVQGETQKMHFLFSKLTKEEFNAFCLKKSWEIYKKFPEDNEIKIYTSEVTKDFVKYVSTSITYFEPQEKYNDSIITSYYAADTIGINSVGNKYGKSTKKVKKSTTLNKGFAPYVMADMLNYKPFTDEFVDLAKHKIESDSTKVKEEEVEEDEYEERFFVRIFKKKKKPTGEKINKFILLDLAHMKFDERKSQPMQFMASASKKKMMLNQVEDYAKLNSVDMTMLIPEKLESKDLLSFNDRALLENWFIEQNENDLIDNKINIKHSEILELTNRLGTNYVGYIMSIGIVAKKSYSGVFMDVLRSMIFTPYLIPTVVNIIEPNAGYLFVFDIYDVRTGKLVYTFRKIYDDAGSADLIKSELYNQFNQLYASKTN